MKISADGTRIAYIAPGAGPSTALVIGNLADGSEKPVMRMDGNPFVLRSCGWSGINRLVCRSDAVDRVAGMLVPLSRLVALDADGANVKSLSQRTMAGETLGLNQFDGNVIDWLRGDDDTVLTTRNVVAQQQTGYLIDRGREGMGVVRQDTRTLKITQVEAPLASVAGYISDGLGKVRIRWIERRNSGGKLDGITVVQYRTAASDTWKAFSEISDGKPGMVPLAVDPSLDVAYALQKLDGRDALYRVKLDGSLAAELVHADPAVDVDNIVTIGRGGRVIGVTFVTDKREVIYFDPDYKRLQAGLAKAIPNLPLIDFVSASADEKKLILHAGSDIDPGRYYLYDRTTRQLAELMPVRPELRGLSLAPMQSVSFKAADGTSIPAYLTLPPGKTSMKGLPAIVMPHGGPGSRDEWGFGDVGWFSQFFAQRGFAVLQPQFRGSTGYGDNWMVGNGFRGWRKAIGDVNDGGRWLLSQGVEAGKLAIVGWSYGGYAALQSNVLDPDLFKAVVSVAPVTDLDLMKTTADQYTNSALVARFLGSGALAQEASPARHADAFKAPVLMFHGDKDLNVDINQARAMNQALKAAGKSTSLIVYRELDHYLDDSAIRTDLLTRSDEFLRKSLGL
ncbi:alpha/beta fold hydrolase [Sphingomonas naphthae]|uniref:Alpha/beta fold hydrolase n=1 Tax=Sphingomonas naphthae TaxID=1813468 RepID=A0ABY7TP28_9SPHN|nr:alpha/beta fold hydrolase [Sphingomonas naphthae]WCT74992.1 alpha/beta fold hydrolase [Sphingomonas naphthae]